ncbi:hypothetical protein CONPUDRAFT_82963, partial [Coniophora puteana RWD-64-598 SS2]
RLLPLVARPDSPDKSYQLFVELLIKRLKFRTGQAVDDIVATLSMLAIRAFAILLPIMTHSQERILVPRLIMSWGDVFWWTSILQEHVVESEENSMDFRLRTHQSLLVFLNSAATNPALLEIMCFKDAAMTLLFRTLKLGAHNPKFSYRTIGNFGGYALDDILGHSLKKDTADLAEVVKRLGGDAGELAEVLLKYLRDELAIENKEDVELDLVIAVISIMSGASSLDELRFALLMRQSVTLVTQVLYMIVNLPLDNADLDHDLVVSCISHAVFYLNRALETTDGTTWVLEAVRAELIPTLLLCNKWLPRSLLPQYKEFVEILSMILPKYTIYIDILDAMNQSLSLVDKLHLEDEIDRKGDLWKARKELRKCVGQRSEAKKTDLHRSDMVAMCSNRKCPQRRRAIPFDDFRRCKECLRAQYCSHECQKQHWTEGGHREACKAWRSPQSNEDINPLSLHDNTYAVKLSLHDLRTRRQEVVDSRTKQELRNCLVLLDYTSYPFTLSVHPLEHAYERPEPPPSRWPDMLKALKAAGPNAVIWRSTIPAGRTGRRFTTGILVVLPNKVEEVSMELVPYDPEEAMINLTNARANIKVFKVISASTDTGIEDQMKELTVVEVWSKSGGRCIGLHRELSLTSCG